MTREWCDIPREEQDDIREMVAKGVPVRVLSDRFNVRQAGLHSVRSQIIRKENKSKRPPKERRPEEKRLVGKLKSRLLLTDEQVLEVKALEEAGATRAELVETYGCSYTTIIRAIYRAIKLEAQENQLAPVQEQIVALEQEQEVEPTQVVMSPREEPTNPLAVHSIKDLLTLLEGHEQHVLKVLTDLRTLKAALNSLAGWERSLGEVVALRNQVDLLAQRKSELEGKLTERAMIVYGES